MMVVVCGWVGMATNGGFILMVADDEDENDDFVSTWVFF